MYSRSSSRASSRRPVIPPPDYSGVLFKNSDDDTKSENELPVPAGDLNIESVANNEAQPQAPPRQRFERSDESRENIPLPLPAPELRGLNDCLPRFPLAYENNPSEPRNKRVLPGISSGIGSLSSQLQRFLVDLFENTGIDDLLLTVLIIMMLESDADPFTIMLLGVLLF